MTKRVAAAGLLLLAITAVVVALWPGHGKAVRVVFVTLDTLRYDAFAPTARGVMPATSSVAGRGTVFQHCYAAAPSTQPTHASLFTGLHPWQHGVTRNGLVLHDRFETLAEIFKAAGFATAAVVASYPVSARFGFAQGFDSYRDGAVRGAGGDSKTEELHVLAPRVVDETLELLDRTSARRQFFWLHFFDPHTPYGDAVGEVWKKADRKTRRARQRELSPAERERAVEHEVRGARTAYLRDVAALDAQLRRLFERLQRDAHRHETHVVVVADHGEAFGEGGTIGHGKWLGEATLRIPCFIASPHVPAGERREMVSTVDFFNTTLALAGLSSPAGRGRDLSSTPIPPIEAIGMRRSFAKPFRHVLLDGRVEWLQRPQFFVVGEEGTLAIGDSSTVDVDRGEVDDVRRTALLERFASFENALSTAEPAPGPGPEEVEALRALGYVQ